VSERGACRRAPSLFYQAPTTYTADVPLSEGQHTVVVEYFEHTGGAVAKFSESRAADLLLP
jgi:hypothetical protein